MTSPFSDRDQRIAFFQQWFSDTIPHSKALGLRIIAVRRGFGSMQLDWREELVGNPETGVLAGGPLTALMDSCCGMSAGACGYAKICLDESIAYDRERHTFGKPLIANQVVRHRLVDMAMRINAVKSTLELLAWRVSQGEKPVAEICMLKNLATSTMEFCANEAMQIFGGSGYLRGAKVERIYRETKVMSIGGGSVEIMKDLAARQMGL